jgi:hypothetical protein
VPEKNANDCISPGGEIMTQFFHRIFRGTILALMLLLAGTANLVSVSYDADDDEDTPPVTVELNLVAPCKKNIPQTTGPRTCVPSSR